MTAEARPAKRVLFLISDTGGGHRSAANAIAAALDELRGPFVYEYRIDDVATGFTYPLDQLGNAYATALKYAPAIYGALYHATNGRRRYTILVRLSDPLYRKSLAALYRSYRPDVIVSVHPLLNAPALRARDDAGMRDVPFVTVVTDLGEVHESWLTGDADAIVVPAREVHDRALARDVLPERLRLIGHPIHPKFEDVEGTKAEMRERLGLPADATIVLLMAGGEGGGKLFDTAVALAKAALPIRLVVVCGRNEAMRARLAETAATLPTPLTAMGFTDRVPELFRAADLLVTKAGPGAIAEAGAARLPIVIYDYVPGQELGNVAFVRANDLGAIALKGPGDVVAAVRGLLADPDRLATIREHQAAIAPVRSSRRIAALIASLAETGRLPVDQEQR
ncbi:MAG TPA: glycosyltransferase [Candidatus Baltobacteraceae bacterium]